MYLRNSAGGAHLNVLLGMSWIKETKTIVKATEGVVSVDGEVIKVSHMRNQLFLLLRRG